jgi:hypothetical protein
MGWKDEGRRAKSEERRAKGEAEVNGNAEVKDNAENLSDASFARAGERRARYFERKATTERWEIR